MLCGKLVELRALETGDFPVLARWLNDAGVMLYWGRPGNTVAPEEVAADEVRNAARGTSRKYIIQTPEGRPIGQIDYYDLDWQARSAWVSILIGDPDFWGGGYGTDAMRALLTHLFDQMGLHRVALTVHETNARAQRSYAKNGFKAEGILRDWAFFNGKWVNGVVMSVLAEEFPRD
ncbi:MAG TPA: GNAT family protein [Chloroflexota bacterium]|nr:GNAT family protein [Chloroflexota bacterium]